MYKKLTFFNIYQRKNPLPVPSIQDSRPTQLAFPNVVLGPGHTSTPMETEDVAVIPQLISPILDSMSTPTEALAVAIPTPSTSNSSSNIGDGSSRYDIPQPLREAIVDLRQPDLPGVQDVLIEDAPDNVESTDDEEPLWHIEERAMSK